MGRHGTGVAGIWKPGAVKPLPNKIGSSCRMLFDFRGRTPLVTPGHTHHSGETGYVITNNGNLQYLGVLSNFIND